MACERRPQPQGRAEEGIERGSVSRRKRTEPTIAQPATTPFLGAPSVSSYHTTGEWVMEPERALGGRSRLRGRPGPAGHGRPRSSLPHHQLGHACRPPGATTGTRGRFEPAPRLGRSGTYEVRLRAAVGQAVAPSRALHAWRLLTPVAALLLHARTNTSRRRAPAVRLRTAYARAARASSVPVPPLAYARLAFALLDRWRAGEQAPMLVARHRRARACGCPADPCACTYLARGRISRTTKLIEPVHGCVRDRAFVR